MKYPNYKCPLRILGLILALALVLGTVLALVGAQPQIPENPIDSSPAPLEPESMNQSGGNGAGDRNKTDPTTEPTTESTTEPATEPTTEPAAEPTTEPTTEPATAPTAETGPSKDHPSPTQPPEAPPPATQPPETQPPVTQPRETQPPVTQPSVTQPPDLDSTDPTTDPTETDTTDPSGPEPTGTLPDPSTPGTDPTSPTAPDPGSTDPRDPETEPHIVTNLQNRAWTPKELKNDTLPFYAYGAGGTGLSVKVYWKERHSTANNGQLLTPESGSYSLKMALNTSYQLTLYLYQNGKALGAHATYYVSYQAKLANEDAPQVGSAPPVIYTNRDGVTDPIRVPEFVLRVAARTGGEDGGEAIYENHLKVWLDDTLVTSPTGNAWGGFEYTLRFSAPSRGDTRTYTVKILAWDDEGNSTCRTLSIDYETVSKGDPIGTATVQVDITTLGLGIMDEESLTITQGKTYAETVLQALDDFGYTPEYGGTPEENGGFYLIRLTRGDMMYGAEVDPRLWSLILRDGITLTDQSDWDSLGERDYTWGSGWMYDVNGAYPGFGMSEGYPSDGEVITLRFTLAFGKDIDGYGATGGDFGSLSSYCGVWINGAFTPLSHDYQETNRVEATDTEDGYIERVCSKCGEVEREILPARNPKPTEPTTEPTAEPTTEPTAEPTTETPTEPSAPPPANPPTAPAQTPEDSDKKEDPS